MNARSYLNDRRRELSTARAVKAERVRQLRDYVNFSQDGIDASNGNPSARYIQAEQELDVLYQDIDEIDAKMEAIQYA